MRYGKALVFMLVLLSLCSAPVFGQVLGALKGTVTDKTSKAPLEDVKVTITSEQAQAIQYELKTDKKGYFYKGGLQPGFYQIRFDRSGYLPAADTRQITIGETQNLAIEMETARPTAGPAEALINKGLEQLKAAQYSEAVETFSKVLQTDAANFVFLYYRGFAYEKSKEWAKALADYQKASELKPDFLLALAAMGNIYAKQKEFAKAIEYYQKALQAGTPDIISLYNYGVSLVNSGNSADACAIFERLISLNANYADAYYELGIIYLGQNNTARAKELLQKFLQLDPSNKNAEIAKQILDTLK